MNKPMCHHPLLILISVITVLSLAFSTTAPAYAQKDNPGKNEGNQGQGKGQEKALLKLFERLQAWQVRQTLQFEQAEAVSALLEEFINQSGLEGYDTQTLQDELKAYKEQIKEARKSFQLAQVTIATHYGIDENGEMYSVKSTRQMIKVASRSFGESHRLLTKAVKDIRQALHDWQLANGENSTTTEPLDLSGP